MRALSTFVVLMFLGLSSLSASTLTVASGTSSADNACSSAPCDYNNEGGPLTVNVVIPSSPPSSPPLDPSWSTLAGANWISYANTVCPGCTPSNPTPTGIYAGGVFYNPTVPNSFITFTQLFTIPLGASGGMLQVLADDSVVVLLNGSTVGVFDEPSVSPFNFQTGGAASNIPYTSFSADLVSGLNTLQFEVYNLGSGDAAYPLGQGENGNGTGGVSSFGLSYVLTLNLTGGSNDVTPEVGSVALVGLGLLLVGIRYGGRFLKSSAKP